MPTEEEKQKIRYLSRYRQLDAKITRLLEEQRLCREMPGAEVRRRYFLSHSVL